MTHKGLRLFGPLVLLASVAGCSVGPDYHPPKMATPDAFVSTTPDAAPIDYTQWWRSLNDPQLNDLVEQAIAANPDLEIALARLQQVRTQQYVLIGAALPNAGAGFGGGNGTGSDLSRGRVPSPLTAADSTSKMKTIGQVAGFDAGWELDLFGGLRREIEAGSYDAEAMAEVRNQVLINVIADVVNRYMELRGAQMKVSVLRENIELTKKSRDFVEMRFERGMTNELDLTLGERQLATLNAEIAPLDAQIDDARFALATLLGRFPEDFSQLSQPASLPTLPNTINLGLPIDILKRRPDIRQAERQLAAATARVGVATANLFPKISLTGAMGAQSPSIGLAQATHLWSMGPSAYWPLLDFGSLDAQISVADLQTQQQLATYKQSILSAVRDVDSSVATFRSQQDRVKNLGDALLDSQRSVTLATKRYNRGLTDFLNVVDAERQQYALEAQYVSAQQTAAKSLVSVFKSLGGGWENYQAAPPIHPPRPAIEALLDRLFASPQTDPAQTR